MNKISTVAARARGRLACPALIVLAFGTATPGHAADPPDWLRVDTRAMTLTVMHGPTAGAVYAGISIGQDGATRRKRTHDRRTPLGTYRIRAIRDSLRFHRFIELDYPSLEDASQALDAGRIDPADYERIRRAHEQQRQPPGDTPLGGAIGIHGVGGGDRRIHADYHWTDGCIALTDEQIERLLPWLAEGMTVVIQ